MKTKKKILVIGGTGFIGYHLIKKAIKNGLKVTSISTNPPPKKRKVKKVKYLYCDITQYKILKAKINQYYDYIVNLGGYVDHSNKKKTFNSHYKGCKNLAKIFVKLKPKRFIQIGSSVEYGKLKSPHNEKFKCNHLTLNSTYGKAKLKATNYLLKLFKQINFPVIIFRLYLCYGPLQDINRFLPIVIDGCIKNKKFPCSHGKQLRDFLHVDDVINAIFKSLKNNNAIGEIINLGSGNPKKIKNIINYIKNKLKGGDPQFGQLNLRKDELLNLYPSIRKANQILKWKPKVNFFNGINKTIEFYKKNG